MNYAISRAESICLQLQRKTDLPEHIKDLINQPKDNIETLKENVMNQDNNEAADNEVSGSSNCTRRTDEEVVELVASTQSVF